MGWVGSKLHVRAKTWWQPSQWWSDLRHYGCALSISNSISWIITTRCLESCLRHCSVSAMQRIRSSRNNSIGQFSVPILLLTASLIFVFGQDHPSGRWEERPKSNTVYLEKDHVTFDTNEKDVQNKQDKGLENARVNAYQGQEEDVTPVNSVVEGSPNLMTYLRILISPMTWLPPLAYMTTFGLELAIDSNMANVLFALFNTKRPDLTQTQAGYYTSTL